MKIIIIPLLCLFGFTGHTQSTAKEPSPLVIGMTFPNLKFTNAINYKKKDVSIREFRNKWIILDFWGLGCTSCIAAMPKLNDLQLKYADNLQILLIGYQWGKVQSYFQTLVAKNHWKLSSVFDTAAFKRFSVLGMPYEIWIDNKGTVQALTSGEDVTEANINDFIHGIKFAYTEFNSSNPFDPILASNNAKSTLGDSVFYFRSTLAPYNAKGGGTSFTMDSTRYMLCTGLLNMYQMAYNPTIQVSKITLAMRDTSKFSSNPENLYCYELYIPHNRTKEASYFMQQDLERFFGYRARMETLDEDILSLVADSSNHLSTTGNNPLEEYSVAGIHLVNQPFSNLVDRLEYYLSGQIPLKDDTHFKGRIDINLTANMIDIQEVNAALKAYGLSLQKHKERIDMLVIYDSKEN